MSKRAIIINGVIALFILIFVFLFAILTNQFNNYKKAYATSIDKKIVLTELDEKDSTEYITTPKQRSHSQKLGENEQETILKSKNNPEGISTFKTNGLFSFTKNDNYVSSEIRSKNVSSQNRDLYYLQDSWVQDNNGNWVSSGGAWDPDWRNYNCYAYAIEMLPNENDYYSKPFQPGDFSGYIVDNPISYLYEKIVLTQQDLMFLGYQVSIYDYEPESILPGQSLICIRCTTDDDVDNDYHFMRKNFDDGYWYHKPGLCAPLRYKYSPSYKDWINEVSYEGIESLGSYIYDSDIYYIVYGDPVFLIDNVGNDCYISGVDYDEEDSLDLNISLNIDGKNVVGISDEAFMNYTWLNDVVIPSAVTTIGQNVFNGTGIWNNTSSNSIVYADNWAVGCKGTLGLATLSEGTIGISDSAFYNCTSLTDISIPSSITTIGQNAFNGTGIWNNTSSNSIVYADNWAVGCKGTLGLATLSEGTIGISDSAFYNCTSLTGLKLSSSLSFIGDSAFSGCVNLEDVFILNFLCIVDIGSNCFYDTSIDLQIYVPSGLYSSYIQNNDWNTYSSYITIVPSNILVEGLYPNSYIFSNVWNGNSFWFSESFVDIYYYDYPDITYSEIFFYLGDIMYDYNFSLVDISTLYLCLRVDDIYDENDGFELYDDNWDYITRCGIVEDYFVIPLIELLDTYDSNTGELHFYLYPEASTTNAIWYYVQDFEIFIILN